MNYNPIDLDTWKRKEHYLHFTKEVNCACCLTAKIDITELVKAVNQSKLSFYTAFLYCICNVINAHEEFKMSYLHAENKLIVWDEVVPSHVVFHKDTETFTRIWSKWNPDFPIFYRDCQRDIAQGRQLSGCSVPHVPENTFDVSCIPWLDYSAMSLHIPENQVYLAPILTWGKYTQQGKKTRMALTMQIHHAAADGFHISRFFYEVEKAAFALAQTLHDPTVFPR